MNSISPSQVPGGKRWQAIQECRDRLRLSPRSVPIHLELARLMSDSGARGSALKLIRDARRLAPENEEARFAEALMLIEALRLEEAAMALRGLLNDNPGHRQALSTLLYLLNLLPGQSSEDIDLEHRERSARCYGSSATAGIVADSVQPGEPLRVGLLSADLRDHPVGRFVESLASHIDQSRISLHAFHNWPAPDTLTHRLQTLLTSFERVAEDTDDALYERLRRARLDVLIDLSGHTLGHRLAVLARKPCPLQLSWLGYPIDTGLTAIDGRIADPVLLGSDVAAIASGAIVLPGHFACFSAPTDAPEPAGEPTRTEFVLGSFHRLEKINRQVIDTWAGILRQAPSAQLLIARDQIDAARATELSQQFQALGVPPDRVQFQHLDDAPYWHLYDRIDVLLDVFPWSGHTLACEALWMGVPVLTLNGPTGAGRLVASVLQAVNHPEWISTDRQAYCQKALDLVAQGPRDQLSRSRLRTEVGRSRLMDAAAFAHDFSAALLARVRLLRQ